MLLTQAGRERVQRALRQAELSGWIDRRPGGRGHSDTFEFRDRQSRPVKNTDRQSRQLSTDRDRQSRQLNGIGDGGAAAYEGVGGVAGDEIDAVAVDGGAHARAVTEHARRAMEQHGEKLSGFRSALEDYLADHVPPEKQRAYVHTVACWVDDPAAAFKRPDGTTVANHAEQAAILAEALNELAAGDEGRMKWPTGDVRNLKTKVGVIIQQRTDPHHRSRGRAARHPKAGDRGAGFQHE